MLYVLWHGGSSYSAGDMKDLEEFRSIRSAKFALIERYESGGGRSCRAQRVGQEAEWTRFPAVDLTSSMEVYTYDPREVVDPWPDFRLFFGPRGGVQRENY